MKKKKKANFFLKSLQKSIKNITKMFENIFKSFQLFSISNKINFEIKNAK